MIAAWSLFLSGLCRKIVAGMVSGSGMYELVLCAQRCAVAQASKPPSLQAYNTCSLLLEERQNLAPSQLPAHDNLARCINAVDLKDVLREINSDRGNFVHGRLPPGGS
jgi:hypothetical protein